MGILDGCLVVELSEVYQAPLAAQVLGDFGADVIKVERPGEGEILRRMDSVAQERGGMSSYFAAVNRNKYSIVLDLKSDGGKDAMHSLLSRADVFIHNLRPGVLERLGFSYDILVVRNPRLIYASATGFGESGPMSHMGGQDLVIQSVSGMACASAGTDGAPRFANAPSVDFASGMILAQGIMAALLERERSGLGQKVSVSLLDTAMAIQSLEAASQLIYGYETRWFNRALNFVAQTKNGWITVLGFFRNNPLALLCKAFKLPDASLQPHLRTIADQISHREEICTMFEPLFAEMTQEQALELLGGADVLCAPILQLPEALAHPQVKHNGMIIDVDVAGQGRLPVIGNPLKLSRTPAEVRRGPPQLDADAEEVRAKFLCA